MELLTLAGIGTIILTGVLTRMGEMALDKSVDQLNKLVKRKSPKTFQQLEAAAKTPELLLKAVEMMAILIEEDEEIKQVAKQVAEENKDNPDVMNQLAIIKQTGLRNFEAEELEGEITQKVKGNVKTNIEQIGIEETKIQGKATLKINQDIE